MFKKVITTILIFTVFLPVNSYALIFRQDTYSLTRSSLLKKAKIVISNENYLLMKINDKHYIYLDNADNFTELFKPHQKWQAKYNNEKYQFNTNFLDETGIKTSLEKEEQKGYSNILEWLLKKDYEIKIKNNIMYLKSTLKLLGGGATYKDVKMYRKQGNIEQLCLIANNDKNIHVRAAAIRALGDICTTGGLDKLKELGDFLNNYLKSPEERIQKALNDMLKKLEKRVQALKEKKQIDVNLNEILKKLKVSFQAKLKVIKKETLLPEEVLIKSFREVLEEFKKYNLEEILEFEKEIQKVIENISKIREKNELDISQLSTNINKLTPYIEKMICSYNLEVKLLGTSLFNKIRNFIDRPEYEIRTIARYMLEKSIEVSKLLIQKCFIEQVVIPIINREINSNEYKFLIDYEIKKVRYENEKKQESVKDIFIWTIKLQNNKSKKTQVIATCISDRKESGRQIGTEITINFKKRNNSIKYFIKTHQDFHISISYTGKATRTESREIRPVNLREMVIYRMLEKLGLGAKVHFVVNPYARSGLFIASEELVNFKEGIKLEKYWKETIVEEDFKPIEDEVHLDKLFEELDSKNIVNTDYKIIGDIESIGMDFMQLTEEQINFIKSILRQNKNEKFKNFFDKEFESTESTSFKTGIHEIDLISRIFNLTDFNRGNYGCIGDIDNIEWKLIDFLVVNDERSPTLSGFKRGNTTVNYPEPGILDKFLRNRPESEKISIGHHIMQTLKNKRNFYKHLEAVSDEIASYIEKVIPENQRAKEKEKLENYKKYVKRNFKNLEQALATEHIKKIIKKSLIEENLDLTIDSSEGIDIYRKSLDKGINKFYITKRVLKIAGRISILFGKEYTLSLIMFAEKMMVKQTIEINSTLMEFIKKLDTLKHKDDEVRVKSLLNILELLKMNNILNIIKKNQKTNLFNYNKSKNILLAA